MPLGYMRLCSTFVYMTTTDIRIDLPLMEYSKRRDIVLTECYLTLGEHYMHYKISATYEQLDEDTEVWIPKKANYRWCRPRVNLSDVSMYYDNPEGLYSVGIDFTGVSDGNNWLFAEGKSALAIYNQLVEYMSRNQ